MGKPQKKLVTGRVLKSLAKNIRFIKQEDIPHRVYLFVDSYSKDDKLKVLISYILYMGLWDSLKGGQPPPPEPGTKPVAHPADKAPQSKIAKGGRGTRNI